MSILGVDFGTRCLGLALGQKTSEPHFTVSPIEPLVARGTSDFLINLKQICRDYDIKTAVFGLPYFKDGREGPLGRKIRRFGLEFKAVYNQDFPENKISVEFVDEALTSFEATRKAHQMAGSRQKKKEKINSLSAVLILENYFYLLENKSQTN